MSELPTILGIVREILKTYPNRTWTLSELADEAGVELTDAKVAVERLVAHGELIRKRGEEYCRPVLEGGRGAGES